MIDNSALEFEDDSEDEDINLESDGHPLDAADDSGIGIGVFPSFTQRLPSLKEPLAQHQLNTPLAARRSHHQPGAVATNSSGVNNKKNKKRSKAVEVDDSRPESDRQQFNSLQQAKKQQRILQQQQLRATTPKMAATTRNQFAGNDKDSPTLDPSNVSPTSATTQEESQDSPDSQDNLGSVPKKTGAKAKTSFANYEEAAKGNDKLIDQMCANQRVLDSKLKKEKRSAVLANCRRQIYSLQVDYGRMKLQNAELQKKITALEAAASKSISRSKAAKLRVCEEQKQLIEQKTKEDLWQSTKFVTCHEDLERATEKVLNFCQLGEKTQNEIDSWVITYKPVVKKAINSLRNYLTAELKKLAFDFQKNGQELPTPNLLLSLAMRKIPATNEDKFAWYWTKALTKVVSAKKWCAEVFYYTTILKAKVDMSNKDSKALFTVSHEAMICLVWENNFEKWQEQYKWKTDLANHGQKMPIMPGKWTTSTEGQAEWGGWSAEGLSKYNELKQAIRGARKGQVESIHAFEEKFLAKLRKQAGIDCDTHDDQTRMNRAKKRKLNADKPVEDIRVHKAISTVDEEDEEDE